MYLIKVKDDFCAAHFLEWADGSAEGVHGHNWKVEIVVRCERLDNSGIGIDYLYLYKHLHELLNEKLDHKNLNLIKEFSGKNPTSENVAKWIFDKMNEVVKNKNPKAKTQSVTVCETDQFSVTYEVAAGLMDSLH